MTFEDFENEKPVSLWQFLITACLAAAAVAALMFFTGCGTGSGDDDTQTQTITIVSGNDLSVDCSDNSTVAAEEEDDEDDAEVIVVESPDDTSASTDGQQFAGVPILASPLTPAVSRAQVEAELAKVQEHGLLLTARVQECNGGQIIANGVDANVDVQIDEIEEITGEGALVRVLKSAQHFADGPSDSVEVLVE